METPGFTEYHVLLNRKPIMKCSKPMLRMRWKYGQATIVFDGYGTPYTKYATHHQGTNGKVGMEVTFREEMKVTQKKNSVIFEE